MWARKDPSCTHTAVVLSSVCSGRFIATIACRICAFAEKEKYFFFVEGEGPIATDA